jgi:hypothetical protein
MANKPGKLRLPCETSFPPGIGAGPGGRGGASPRGCWGKCGGFRKSPRSRRRRPRGAGIRGRRGREVWTCSPEKPSRTPLCRGRRRGRPIPMVRRSRSSDRPLTDRNSLNVGEICLASGGAEMVKNLVFQDAGEPAAFGGTSFEAVASPQCGEQGLLHHILGL